LNAQNLKVGEGKQKDGFTMVANRKFHPTRKKTQENAQKIPTKKSYDFLNQLPGEEEVGDPQKKTIRKRKRVKTRTKWN